MNNIGICFKDDTRELLADGLMDLISKLEDIKKSGKEIDPKKLPGIFHYHKNIDGYIKDIKQLEREITMTPICP